MKPYVLSILLIALIVFNSGSAVHAKHAGTQAIEELSRQEGVDPVQLHRVVGSARGKISSHNSTIIFNGIDYLYKTTDEDRITVFGVLAAKLRGATLYQRQTILNEHHQHYQSLKASKSRDANHQLTVLLVSAQAASGVQESLKSFFEQPDIAAYKKKLERTTAFQRVFPVKEAAPLSLAKPKPAQKPGSQGVATEIKQTYAGESSDDSLVLKQTSLVRVLPDSDAKEEKSNVAAPFGKDSKMGKLTNYPRVLDIILNYLPIKEAIKLSLSCTYLCDEVPSSLGVQYKNKINMHWSNISKLLIKFKPPKIFFINAGFYLVHSKRNLVPSKIKHAERFREYTKRFNELLSNVKEFTCDDPHVCELIDVPLPELTHLTIHDELRERDAALFPNLTSLSIKGNLSKDVAALLPKLTYLELRNPCYWLTLSDEISPLNHLQALIILKLRSIELPSDFGERHPNLTHLTLSGPLVSLKPYIGLSLRELFIATEVPSVDLKGLAQLRTLVNFVLKGQLLDNRNQLPSRLAVLNFPQDLSMLPSLTDLTLVKVINLDSKIFRSILTIHTLKVLNVRDSVVTMNADVKSEFERRNIKILS